MRRRSCSKVPWPFRSLDFLNPGFLLFIPFFIPISSTTITTDHGDSENVEGDTQERVRDSSNTQANANQPHEAQAIATQGPDSGYRRSQARKEGAWKRRGA
ncbi:hypothetical protein CJI97_005651 [Candidozyma auris]|uniref:Uncharacterized protein n=1 Tax=Candidozyma auris TaxID=498019 RepID=A0A0L0NMX0_CANAR|nr:hypothetical protein QG37_08364 [[Candida] auris]PIS48194.1 hypothetical protein CJI97_005651 [[Candida] auris]